MAEHQPTIEITFRDLAALKGGGNTRHPLSTLVAGDHLHGELRIVTQGRPVPHLGY